MIQYRNIERLIVDSLQNKLLEKGYNCPVILANQVAPIPHYPYISYTVTTPTVANMKGYSIDDETGTRYKPLSQIWSFTVQSDDDEQAINVCLETYDWFALSGNTYLSDNKIVAEQVTNITNRDNLISINYEYRRGFDVQFLLMHEISKADAETAGYINTSEITHTLKEV